MGNINNNLYGIYSCFNANSISDIIVNKNLLEKNTAPIIITVITVIGTPCVAYIISQLKSEKITKPTLNETIMIKLLILYNHFISLLIALNSSVPEYSNNWNKIISVVTMNAPD